MLPVGNAPNLKFGLAVPQERPRLARKHDKGRMAMKKLSNNADRAKWLSALGIACCLVLAHSPVARAQDGAITAQTLVDRAQIEDLLTRYYYNLGHGSPDSFSTFYADDAELILGPNRYKGKEGIEGAYKSAGQNSPGRKAFSFNVTLSNPLIIVHGDTATAQLIFTEIIIDTQGAAPRVLQQGREYDNFVKVNGQWRFKKRQILPGAQSPTGWTG